VRDFVLHGQNVGELAVVLVAPQVVIVAGVDELGADDELIAVLHDASRDHAFYLQVVRHHLRIDVATLVVEDRRTRHHRQIGNLREAIDEALGETVAEVFAVGIIAGIDEGQHCNRRNFLRAAGAAKQEIASRGEDDDRGRGGGDPGRFAARSSGGR